MMTQSITMVVGLKRSELLIMFLMEIFNDNPEKFKKSGIALIYNYLKVMKKGLIVKKQESRGLLRT